MTRFGHKLNYVINTFVKHTPGIVGSECVYLACMAVKIEHTVGGHNHGILQQCISDDYVSQVWAPTRVKLAKMYAFVHQNLFACTEN